jgi:hypothetical protein
VAAEIVHDDDVAGLEHWNELLFDIGTEAFTVDRTVEDARSGELVATQGAEEGPRAPMAMRRKPAQAMTLRAPSTKRGHAGLDPGFVDEHQTPWIEACLPRPPAPPPAGDIGTGLLKGEQRFF